jgi:ribosomal protein S18 acetylase RimI-like enzyme
VAFGNVPEGVRKGLPRYPIPVGHLGRLAVAGEVQRQGLGAMLLVDALRRIQRISQDLAICGVEVNALDDGAKAFYLKYGFVELLDDHRHLYLPMSVVHAL